MIGIKNPAIEASRKRLWHCSVSNLVIKTEELLIVTILILYLKCLEKFDCYVRLTLDEIFDSNLSFTAWLLGSSSVTLLVMGCCVSQICVSLVV